MTERKKIEKYLGEWSPEVPMTVDVMVASLRELQAEHADYTDVRVSLPDYGEFYGFMVYGDRLETDGEYEARLGREAAALARKLARAEKQRLKDEADFERLRKKLGR